MNPHSISDFEPLILATTGTTSLRVTETIQELWSGYGKILRISLDDSERKSVVVKHVVLPEKGNHPRGWNSDRSHLRKIRSYEVETEWYRNWSSRCSSNCRIPDFLAFERQGDEVLLLLEDLDQAGFPLRLQKVEWKQIEICLEWLANFHAAFPGSAPEGLWKTGTYWHLETRPDELDRLEDQELKQAAGKIDTILEKAKFQTLVHGDAKLANFCFSESGDRVAALDFQYVGGGCGMKDVAYFIGSCLDEDSCESHEDDLLDCYFGLLKVALAKHRPDTDPEAVIAEWRKLFPVAWTDFHRFLKGWCPGHWKINSYSEKLSRRVLANL